jgi:predicted phage terminase large subunit-like protein
MVIVGQRLHPDDLIGTLLRSEEKWTVLTLPAIAEKEEFIPIGPGRWHLRHSGDLLHPAQQSRDFLQSLRSQHPETFAAQYQQNPIPPGGSMIRRDQIRYCDELPKTTTRSSVYIQSWDTAQKPGEANARSACLDILVEGDKYFVTHALAGQWEYYDLEQLVLSRADQHKPDVIMIEDAGFGTALISTLNRRRLPVVAVKPEGDKKSRLLREMFKFANGQVFFLRSAPGRADLEIELLSFPGGRRNDQVDALSQALAYKYVPHLWTNEALENLDTFLSGLMLSCARL